MAETYTPVCNFGEAAHDFSLLGVDGNTYTLADCRGEKGTLIMFICNHCPFVKAVQKKLVRDAQEIQNYHIKTVAIMSNDPAEYAEDSFANMKKIAKKLAYPFPYLFDETQEVAKQYGAVCTPDFFAYNADLRLQYRGRLDDSGMANRPDAKRELFAALRMIATSQQGPAEQITSVGCSIKWRRSAS